MKKKILFAVICLIIVITIAFMLWPLSFSDLVPNNAEMRIIITDFGLLDGFSTAEVTNYIFQPDSDEYTEIWRILGKYSFHRSHRSFFKDTSVSGRGGVGYSILIIFVENGNLSASIQSLGTSETNVNNRIYRIGYWGNKKNLAMMNEIRSILDQSTPLDVESEI